MAWDESKHPRDSQGRFTDAHGAYRQNTSYGDILRFLEANSGAVSGAIDPDSERGEAHANRYYESIRRRKDDVPAIAKNTGFSEGDIQKIKNYIFIDEHDLSTGRSRFYPDCDMAHSWQRLIEGNAIAPDITLLRHELMELQLVEKGHSQGSAHKITNRIYNYKRELDEWKKHNGRIKKH